ncbi:hypothetical protein KTE19_13105, partial [Lentilactobacillus sp. IMAU92037]|nr:hypothetical protein [Lentilactobacillus dabitei]
APEDKVTDNKNGTIEVNGSSITPADDSQVAHLSGANNFDTVPTVNNNPLLLASSLPSDLARTGQAQTFTAAQTFSIAPTIKDASKDKGDNQAATMADLKSVEASAWRQLDSSHIIFSNIGDSGNSFSNSDKLCLYRIDSVNKRIYISLTIIIPNESRYSIKLDFSNIVSSFTSKGPGHMISDAIYNNQGYYTYEFNIKGGNISINIDSNAALVTSGYQNDCWFGYDTLLI